jgi:hypothetical protein
VFLFAAWLVYVCVCVCVVFFLGERSDGGEVSCCGPVGGLRAMCDKKLVRLHDVIN